MKGFKQFCFALCTGLVGMSLGMLVATQWPKLSAASEDLIGHGHQLVAHDEIAATCEKAGVHAYWTCPDCDLYFSDKNGLFTINEYELQIPKLKHQSSNKYHYKAVDATCTTAGNIEYYVCANGCGGYFKKMDAATKVCTESIDKDKVIVAQRNHKDVHHVTAQQPTSCRELGHKEYWECDDCGQKFDDKNCTKPLTDADVVLSAKHNVRLITEKAAQCDEDGYDEHYFCPDCGQTFRDEDGNDVVDFATLVKPRFGHMAGAYTEERAATCVENGERAHWTCNNCGKFFADDDCQNAIDIVIPNFGGHKYELVVIDPAHLEFAAGRYYDEATGTVQNRNAVYYQVCKNCGGHKAGNDKECRSSFATFVGVDAVLTGTDGDYYDLVTLDSAVLNYNEADGKYYYEIKIKTPKTYGAHSTCDGIEDLGAAVDGDVLTLRICLDSLPAAGESAELVWKFNWDGDKDGTYEQVIKVKITTKAE